MGKRGPSPGGATKGAPTGIRFDRELKDRLEEAARTSGRTFSEEVSMRLAASLGGGDVVAAFDGLETYALCRLIAAALANVRVNVGHRWHEHPLAFRDARNAIDEILGYFQPIGDIVVPEDHPAVVILRRMGASEDAMRAVLESIRNPQNGKQIGRLLIEEIEVNPQSLPHIGPAHDLKDIAGTLRQLISTAGMSGEATALENAHQEKMTREGNEAALIPVATEGNP